MGALFVAHAAHGCLAGLLKAVGLATEVDARNFIYPTLGITAVVNAHIAADGFKMFVSDFSPQCPCSNNSVTVIIDFAASTSFRVLAVRSLEEYFRAALDPIERA